ncbi:MAG: hypothetical protein ACRDRL_03550, partial [Sciscionella sp.]
MTAQRTPPVPAPIRAARWAAPLRHRVAGFSADDRGAVVFWVVPIMAGLIALAGLVVDGGNVLAAR